MSRRCVLCLWLLALVAGCDKAPMNGDLDGMWQLLREEKTDTLMDVKADGIYVSFQLHTVQFDAYGESRQYYGTFTHSGDTLRYTTLCHASSLSSSSDDDELVTQSELASLAPWGVYSLEPVYAVLRLSDEHLTLQSDSSTLYFRKF